MAVEVEVVGAVVAVCSVCGERSRPLDPDQVEEWSAVHEERHAREVRREYWAAHGHATQLHTHWVDNDDSEGHVSCSCGNLKKRPVKINWLLKVADDHLLDVETELQEASPPTAT